MKKVAIVMGSAHDLETVRPAISLLQSLKVPLEVHVLSAHRTPERVVAFAQDASSNDFGVIIAAAGMAAHLAGVIAAHTILPVVGLPLSAQVLDGMDALLATVQMPPGIPVATVGVDAAKNAALLAVQILAIENKELALALQGLRVAQQKTVLEADAQITEEFRPSENQPRVKACKDEPRFKLCKNEPKFRIC